MHFADTVVTGHLGTTTDVTEGGRTRPRPPTMWAVLPAGLRWSLLVYLLSRMPVVAGLVAFWARHPGQDLSTIALHQDGWWYVGIAERGYSTSLRPSVGRITDYHHAFSDWAFFPGYPLVVRAVHVATLLPYLYAALLASAVLGLLAVWAVHTLGSAFGGAPVGRAAALLVAAWPGAGAFTLPYSEGLFVAAAAMALVYLQRERWVVAGLFGAVATATRPTGVAIVVATAAVAAVRLARRRDPRPIITPLLSLTGIAAFVLYGWARTGDVMIWRHAENLWGQTLDVSQLLIKHSVPVLLHPRHAMHGRTTQPLLAHAVLDLVGVIVLLAMVVVAVRLRRRLSIAGVVYTLVATALVVGYSAVAPRPRMVLLVLPGFVWLAAVLPRRVVYGLSALFMLATPFVVYLWSWRVTP